jgi:hypothetical protein
VLFFIHPGGASDDRSDASFLAAGFGARHRVSKALDDILEGCAKLADAKAGTETIAVILPQVADTIEQCPGD